MPETLNHATPEISPKEHQNRMSSVRFNHEQSVLLNLKNEILQAMKDKDEVTARGAVEELFVVASSYESYLLDSPKPAFNLRKSA